ncbi:MAG: TrkH family potassium uptake protein [Gemmatimonadota bacterium]
MLMRSLRWDLDPFRPPAAGRRGLSAVQLFVGSFAGLILVGTVGLLVLPGLYTGPHLGFVDALFMATSAVCVTGLIVVDTATYFTPLGQAWILLLIQLGGLGIMTIATLIIVALGQRLSRDWEQVAGGDPHALSGMDAASLVRLVIRYTLVIEAVGALGLWLLWRTRLGSGAVWHAVFHSVSAFCNAGFSTFSDSLSGFRSDAATLVWISALIIVGGLGFVVLADLRRWVVAAKVRRLSLNSRIVLVVTAFLLVGGALLFLLFESHFDLESMGLPDRTVNAWFMSVTARTAGFNTVDYATATNASLLLTLGLMLVGGSPGSTAGGLKTTTVAVLLLLLWSRLRGRQQTSVFGRTIPPDTAERSAGIVIGSILLLGVCVFVLLTTEYPLETELNRARFLSLVFEAHSAFGTVGLSMGATPDLTGAGRLVIVFLMFVGRVGPLAIASSMAMPRGRRPLDYRFAHEDVVVG